MVAEDAVRVTLRRQPINQIGQQALVCLRASSPVCNRIVDIQPRESTPSTASALGINVVDHVLELLCETIAAGWTWNEHYVHVRHVVIEA